MSSVLDLTTTNESKYGLPKKWRRKKFETRKSTLKLTIYNKSNIVTSTNKQGKSLPNKKLAKSFQTKKGSEIKHLQQKFCV